MTKSVKMFKFGVGAGLKMTETAHKSIGVVSFVSLIILCNIERWVPNAKGLEHAQHPKMTKSVKCLGVWERYVIKKGLKQHTNQ